MVPIVSSHEEEAMKLPGMPSDDILAGMELTADEAVALERRLQDAPQDLRIRSRLVGYYAGAMLASFDAAQHLETHALWLIENSPEADVTGCAFCGVVAASQHAERAEKLWRGHLERRPADPRILTHAGRFFQQRKPEFAQELIARARDADPAGDWRLFEEPHYEPAGPSSPPVDESSLAVGSAARFYALGDLAKTSVSEGKLEKAEALATELLALAPNFVGDWNYGNALYCGQHVLGQVALARGDVDQARKRLLQSAETPGSPQLASFGPSMALARALLEQGETDVVLQFLERCHGFWSMGHGKLEAWAQDVRTGRKPNFMANVAY